MLHYENTQCTKKIRFQHSSNCSSPTTKFKFLCLEFNRTTKGIVTPSLKNQSYPNLNTIHPTHPTLYRYTLYRYTFYIYIYI